MQETYDDLAILEYFGYRCGYCLCLLPVFGYTNAGVRKYGGKRSVSPKMPVFNWEAPSGRMYGGFHWEHVIPYAHGGPGDWGNLVPSCYMCNRWKGCNGPCLLVNACSVFDHDFAEELELSPFFSLSAGPPHFVPLPPVAEDGWPGG